MIGIVIAAGRSKRMGPLGDERPKCMLPVNGRPLLHYTIDRLKEVGCGTIVVIVGYKPEQIFADECIFVTNHEYGTNNILHSLMSAGEYLEGDVICSYSDIWCEPEVFKSLKETAGDIVLSVDSGWQDYYEGRTDHPVSEAEKVIYSKMLQPVRIGKTAQPDKEFLRECGEFRGLWRMSPQGSYMFKNLFEELDIELGKHSPFQNAAQWQRAYITDIFQEMIDRNWVVNISLVEKRWAELDTRQDYERLLDMVETQSLYSLMN